MVSNSTKSLIYIFLFVLRIKIKETYEFISVLILENYDAIYRKLINYKYSIYLFLPYKSERKFNKKEKKRGRDDIIIMLSFSK